MPLSLYYIFSFFPSFNPVAQKINENEEIYVLTPDWFDPHNTRYAINKDNMNDWEGNVRKLNDRQ